uniref:Uncharacterized protein n=1 Tax=Zea mays TaxID=4577 RepID=C4J6C1_MAIZE|nr:unknown [Zea mays]
MPGCSTIRAITHSSRIATVSVPRKIISQRTAIMSESDSFSSPSSPSKTSTKSPAAAGSPMASSFLCLCSSMILATNTLTLPTRLLHRLLTPCRSSHLSSGRWSPQLNMPSRSYPSFTISSSSAPSGLAAS